MTSNKPRRVPTIFTDAARNPGFALGAFGLSAWAYVGMSHTIADYEGPELGYGLGIAYEALVIGMAWEGRRRADQALDAGRAITGHRRWLVGAIGVGILSGALAAWHGWAQDEGVFALSRAVAPILAAVAVHLFFQSAASARDLERKAKIQEEEAQTRRDQENAVLDMLDAVRQAKIAPAGDYARHIGAVNDAVTRVHRNVPAAVTETVTGPHLESERVIHNVIREAADLAGAWMPEPEQLPTVTPIELEAGDDITTDAAPGTDDTERAPHADEYDMTSAVLPEHDTSVRVAAAADDTTTRVTARTRVTAGTSDPIGPATARSAWPKFTPATVRATTPAEPMTQDLDVIGGEGEIFAPMDDTAKPEERAERARALAQELGSFDDSGRMSISTAVADQIASIVGRKRRQVYRYLEGENIDTNTGSLPVVPAPELDLDDDQPEGGTAAYAAAAMAAGR